MSTISAAGDNAREAASGWTPGTAFLGVIEAVERLGSRATGDGRQRSARCPAHDDRNPSLRIGAGEERVLLFCQGPCTTEDVLAVLGLPWAALFDRWWGRASGLEAGPGTWTPWRERCPCPPVAHYPYVSETGELLYHHVRGQHKEFAFRRPEASSKSGWRWNLDGVTRVLYRLPELLAAPGSGVVFVAEGESDADALVAAGEVATTTDSGALTGTGAKAWRPEWTEVLAGRDVLICADKDETGKVHARHVAACLEGRARFAWIVESASGKDVRDHLSAGLPVTDLVWWSR